MPTIPTRERVSIHEAGHAVVAHRLGLPLRSITVERCSGEALLEGGWNPAPAPLDRTAFEVAIFAAGAIAERLAGFGVERGETSDARRIQELAVLEAKRRLPPRPSAASEERATRFAQRCVERGYALAELWLRSEWAAVQKLAAVAVHGYLTGAQAREFIALAPVVPLVCDLAHLSELARQAGECEELVASPGFERLVELAADAPHKAEREALAAAHEQEQIARARLMAQPPSPSEQARRAAAADRRRTAEARQGLALYRAHLEARAAAWEKANRSPMRRALASRRPVTRTRPGGWIG